MTSLLPPREIQARVRAGETLESLAEAAQTTVEKIMVYAGPVLAERAHVAGLAQAGSVRRASNPDGPRVLGESVDARLRAAAVDPAGVEWDAWRGLDQRWVVVADVPVDGTTRRATFHYDVAGRSVTTDDDLARWLAGELAERPGPRGAPDGAATVPADAEIPLPPAPAERVLRSVHEGDLSSDVPRDQPRVQDDAHDAAHDQAHDQAHDDTGPVVSGVDAPTEVPTVDGDHPGAEEGVDSEGDGDGQLALGDDAIALVTGGSAARPAPGPAAPWRAETRTPAWLDAATDAPSTDPTPAPAPASVAEPGTGPVARSGPRVEAPTESPQEALFGDPAAPPSENATRAGRRRGRATIPSWDEIMFGGAGDGAPLADPDGLSSDSTARPDQTGDDTPD